MAAGFFPDLEIIDFPDQYGDPLYRRCQEKYGRLEPGECYGFFPALAISDIFGPHRTIENIRRVKAMEHFTILAQLDAFRLARVGVEGAEPVRPIAEADRRQEHEMPTIDTVIQLILDSGESISSRKWRCG
ncbi:hypothetical protein QFZ27_006796 [Inquilinus ginsengisoli]|uniref:T6SS immunity protein Tdi1 domain-containing protein n=1 Tax=Inquilinus ginsengisoli TaxID=363840 RepID=UPI003D1BF066